MPKPRKVYVSGALKARLAGAVRKGRRETIYKMLSRRHDGVVPCFCCGKHVVPEESTLEHILELSKGGTDEMGNLSISHEICNKERSRPPMRLRYDLAQPHLAAAGIDLEADFHSLSSSQVGKLVELAKATGYRRPANANGSLAQYYFDALYRQWVRERK